MAGIYHDLLGRIAADPSLVMRGRHSLPTRRKLWIARTLDRVPGIDRWMGHRGRHRRRAGRDLGRAAAGGCGSRRGPGGAAPAPRRPGVLVRARPLDDRQRPARVPALLRARTAPCCGGSTSRTWSRCKTTSTSRCWARRAPGPACARSGRARAGAPGRRAGRPTACSARAIGRGPSAARSRCGRSTPPTVRSMPARSARSCARTGRTTRRSAHCGVSSRPPRSTWPPTRPPWRWPRRSSGPACSTTQPAADLGYARVPLGDLHSTAALRALAGRRRRGAARPPRRGDRTRRDGDRPRRRAARGRWTTDTAILATAHREAFAALPELARTPAAPAAGLGVAPIVNVHVVYERRVTDLPFAAAVGSPVQWFFDRTEASGLHRALPGGQYLAITVSAADAISQAGSDELSRPVRR